MKTTLLVLTIVALLVGSITPDPAAADSSNCMGEMVKKTRSADGEVEANGVNVALTETTEKCVDRENGSNAIASEPGDWRVAEACDLASVALCHEASVCDDGQRRLNAFFTPDSTGQEEFRYSFCPGEGASPQRQPVTAAMVLRALKRVELPKPEMIVQPPKGRTLVNFDTIFHTEAETLHRTVRLLGQRVQLRIRPTGFTWIHGDGTTQYSQWPGMAFAQGVDMDRYISHQYTDAYVTVHPNVEVSYSADFRVGNGAWRTVPGTVEMTGDPVDLRIIEGRLTLLG